MIVGSRLKERREELGFTQERLGKELGLSKSAISLYEHEKRNPNLETVIELMYILGISADYLLGADEIVKIKDASISNYAPLTKEEFAFINEIRKDDVYYDMLLRDHKRGIEIIKQRL